MVSFNQWYFTFLIVTLLSLDSVLAQSHLQCNVLGLGDPVGIRTGPIIPINTRISIGPPKTAINDKDNHFQVSTDASQTVFQTFLGDNFKYLFTIDFKNSQESIRVALNTQFDKGCSAKNMKIDYTQVKSISVQRTL